MVQLLVAGTPVDIGSRRQRLILAVLALEVNQLVATDRLVSLCWPAEPPKTARHAIHVCVSRLRSALARACADPHRVTLSGNGLAYVLHADAGLVDAHYFRHLVTEACGLPEDERKAAVLRQALRLWRGPALTGIAPECTRERLSRGLEEARLVALEDVIAAELRMGLHRQLLGELTELAEAYPLRELLTAELMLALYRSGQAAAALVQFQRVRHRLAEELGIDPGTELRQLETAILRADPLLAPIDRVAGSGWISQMRST